MSVINDVLQAVIDMAEEIQPYASIVVGALPADNGISMTVGAGAPQTTFMTKGMVYEIDCVLNGKHSAQETVFDTLNDIHQALTMTKDYPATDEYQILDIQTTSSPNYIEREENKQYLYGSSVRVRFFFKKGE